jgi:hypothetical protein
MMSEGASGEEQMNPLHLKITKYIYLMFSINGKALPLKKFALN